jgi:hypothetical protein
MHGVAVQARVAQVPAHGCPKLAAMHPASEQHEPMHGFGEQVAMPVEMLGLGQVPVTREQTPAGVQQTCDV